MLTEASRSFNNLQEAFGHVDRKPFGLDDFAAPLSPALSLLWTIQRGYDMVSFGMSKDERRISDMLAQCVRFAPRIGR